MQVRIVVDQPWDVQADVLAAPFLGEPAFDGPFGELDRRAGGTLRQLASFGELEAKRYATALVSGRDLGAAWLLVVAGGPAGELDREAIVRLGATIERRLAGRSVHRLAVWLGGLPDAVDGGAPTVAELLVRGVVEGSFDPASIYRANPDTPPDLDEVIVVAPGADAAALARAVERGRIIGEGTNLARRLANRAANDVSPRVLADVAGDLATEHGLGIDVLDADRAAELGMGMFLAVGRGSDNPPRMIVLRSGEARSRDARGRLVALVGKGVCFDSGGISIKPADRMEEMKTDKAGACTVIAAIVTAARLSPGIPLMAVAPAVENMPGPHSARPGDVVTALNGKTVEITNTDAEGRLILGDAMTYAERLGATHVVDVATLTGAVARALGHLVTGAFGAPDDWYDEVAAAARAAGERFWRLPLVDEYWPEMESWYAEMANTGLPEGGLIKSALFLRQFVTVPWVHLDIAGSGYFRKATPWSARGATGASTATLVELALSGASA